MKNKLHLFLFAIVALFESCVHIDTFHEPTIEPVASFDYTTDGLTVKVTNTSQGNIVFYSWDFGDGTTSNVENTSHTYEDVGAYSVKLTCYNKGFTKAYTCTKVVKVNKSSTGTDPTDPTTLPYDILMISGIEYVDVDVYLDFYKTVLKDNKNNTIFYTNYTSDMLYSNTLPFTYTLNRTFEIDFESHSYYTLYIYHSAWNDGTTDDIQCLKQNIQASEFRNALKTAAPYIEVHNNSGTTIVRLLCTYL